MCASNETHTDTLSLSHTHTSSLKGQLFEALFVLPVAVAILFAETVPENLRNKIVEQSANTQKSIVCATNGQQQQKRGRK